MRSARCVATAVIAWRRSYYILHSHWTIWNPWPMRVQNVIRSPSSYNGRSHTSSWTHGKIIESWTLLFVYCYIVCLLLHMRLWGIHENSQSRRLKWHMAFGIYPPKIAVWSRSWADVIGNLSGLKAVVFLWRCGPLLWYESNLWDEIATSHQPFFSLWGEMTTNDIIKIRKLQTRLQRTQICPPIAQKRRGQPYVKVSEGYFYIYSLF